MRGFVRQEIYPLRRWRRVQTSESNRSAAPGLVKAEGPMGHSRLPPLGSWASGRSDWGSCADPRADIALWAARLWQQCARFGNRGDSSPRHRDLRE